MKKTSWLLILILCAALSSDPVSASDCGKKKVTRGATNLITAPLEIPRQVRAYWREGAKKTPHIIVWILSGFVKGLVTMTERAAAGVWEIATFPLDVPQDCRALVLPETVFDPLPSPGK